MYVCSIVINTDTKYEISGLENRQIILIEHFSSSSPKGTRMRTNFDLSMQWDLHLRRGTLKF